MTSEWECKQVAVFDIFVFWFDYIRRRVIRQDKDAKFVVVIVFEP